jgi:CRP/FNR family transcriptional regulator
MMLGSSVLPQVSGSGTGKGARPMAERNREAGHVVRFRKGELLFKEGDDSQDFYIVKSGGVRIFRSLGQKDMTLDTIGPGMVAGEIASISEGVRTASGEAVSDTEVIRISKEEFAVIFEKIPEWFRKIALILVQRLREVDEKISRTGKTDYTSHVAALVAMISYSEKAGEGSQGFEIDQKFLEYELMDLLTIPLSEVQAALERLAAKKLLRITGGKVILIDRDALEKKAADLMMLPAGA